MRSILCCSVLLMLSSRASADTLILKDGRKLEWSVMADKGDTLEVELITGTKVTVKKDQIERVIFGKLPEVLTGASITFDKKKKLEVFDIMSKIDPIKVLGGSATLKNGVVTLGPQAMVHTKLPTGFTPPVEYDLSMVVERKGPIGEFLVGIVAGGKQTVITFDAYKNSLSGVMLYDGQGLMSNPDAYKKPVFEKQARTLTFMVRNEGFVVRIDSQDVAAVAVQNFSRLNQHPLMEVPDKSVLFVGCLDGTFSITRMLVSSPK